MNKLEKAYIKILNSARGTRNSVSAPAMLVVTLIFLIAVLSIPVNQPQKLIWLAVYPIVASEMSGIGYGNIFLKSLWILPLAILIGIFNPIIDTSKAFSVSGITISRGWVSFISIIFRALLSFQSLLLLIATSGFLDMFNAMRHIGCPAVLSTQLLLTYRYISVIIEEAIIMNRARQARGYGKKSYPLSMWGRHVGQLLIRSTQRASNIHRAMKARGFSGTLPTGSRMQWDSHSLTWMCCWIACIAIARFVDFSTFITHIMP